jgi:hypothetical protein
MIELAINGWILTLKGRISEEKYVYTIEAVDNWLIANHIEELHDYVNYRQVGFGDCVTKEFDGINSEAFFNAEPTKFQVLFMIGQRTNFF